MPAKTSGFQIWADRAAAAFGIVAAILLMLMMLVTFVDVVGRYLFNSPLPGGFELTEIMLAVLVFAGLPLVCRSEDNVTVTLLIDRLSPTLRSLHSMLMNLIAGGVLFVVAREMWDRAERLISRGNHTTHLEIPLGPLAQLMAILAAISALFLLFNVVMHVLDAAHRRAPAEHDPSRDV